MANSRVDFSERSPKQKNQTTLAPALLALFALCSFHSRLSLCANAPPRIERSFHRRRVYVCLLPGLHVHIHLAALELAFHAIPTQTLQRYESSTGTTNFRGAGLRSTRKPPPAFPRPMQSSTTAAVYLAVLCHYMPGILGPSCGFWPFWMAFAACLRLSSSPTCSKISPICPRAHTRPTHPGQKPFARRLSQCEPGFPLGCNVQGAG